MTDHPTDPMEALAAAWGANWKRVDGQKVECPLCETVFVGDYTEREKALRAALERLVEQVPEWVNGSDGDYYGIECPCCRRDDREGHGPNCDFAKALAAARAALEGTK